MSIFVSKAIYYLSQNIAAISALFPADNVSPSRNEFMVDRIYDTAPIAVFTQVDAQEPLAIDLTAQVTSETWQVDIYTAEYDDLQDCIKAWKSLNGYKGSVDGQYIELIQFTGMNEGAPDLDSDIYRASMNFQFFYNET